MEDKLLYKLHRFLNVYIYLKFSIFVKLITFKVTIRVFKGEQKPKITLSLYESDLIIKTCEPTVLCYKAVKKIKKN